MTVFLLSPPWGLWANPYSLKPLPPLRVIEGFNTEPVGKFPTRFRTYPFQRGKAMQVYSVQTEGDNHYLNATASGETQDIGVQIFKRFYWELSRWPNISWRWRAKAIPTPKNHEKFNDNACGVYIIFGGYGGKAVKYVWSTDLPVGTVTEDTPGDFYVVTAASGSQNLGQWQTVSLNIVKEYQRLFKSSPDKDPVGFGLLTDGDGTKTPAICDYDDFRISEGNIEAKD
ncbi:MAG: DUF3047 domain-containing protein [Deltaproteobacteria bacterium]|nr:DUF3047 domain-containing protein [Deltaproteobacteria bacterium]